MKSPSRKLYDERYYRTSCEVLGYAGSGNDHFFEFERI